MNTILKLLPAPLIRTAGRLQFRFPVLSGPINFLGQLVAGSGVIPRGAGKGLRFNGRGCSPGYVAGTSAPFEQALILKHLLPGMVFYDVGANAGFYAIIGARAVGPMGRVYAFEPMPKLAARVRENADLNSLTNLAVVEAAVSDVDEAVTFGARGPLSMWNSMCAAGTDVEKITVQSVRLDTFSSQHRPPNVIMVDIEGDEIRALQGGLKTIAKHRPLLMVEVHWLGQAFLDFFESVMKPLGYSGTTYNGEALPAEPKRYHALLVPSQ
jgi:FkbM family methyltransferase